jgi:plasmid stability protein
MPNVLIRDVPEEVHSELVRRAAREGRSLQQYLTALLTRDAHTRTLDEVLDRVSNLQGGRLSLAEAVAALHEVREER